MKNIPRHSEANIIKIILLFALLNSSFFIAYGGSGLLRLIMIIFMNISGALLVYFFLKKNGRFKIAKVSLYFRFIFLLLITWSIFISIKSFSFEAGTLISLFGHYLMGWAWLTPLAIVFGFNISNWFFLFNYFGKLLLIGSIIALGSLYYHPKIVFGLLEWMAFFPVLLLTYFLQNKKNKRIVLFSFISFIVLSFFASQRANLLFLAILGLFFTLEFYKQKNYHFKKILLLSLFIISGFILLQQDVKSYDKIIDNDEYMSDTRTFLFEELFDDLSYSELFFGRGALGRYYSPYFESWNKIHEGGDSESRSISEVGYLQMILKGGFLMLIFYLLILIPAAYLGVFKSKNVIGKMSGYLITSYLILWTVSYYPVYSAEYILLWMAVGTTINSRTRLITNRGLQRIFIKMQLR